MRQVELTIIELCEEIDLLKEERNYWKQLYQTERDERNIELNERMDDAKRGVAQALMFALSVKDNQDGSISISKENRNQLAETFKENILNTNQ